MEKPYAAGLVWFRRDLRAHDHAALYHALRSCRRCTAPSSSTPPSWTACRARTGGWSSSANRWCELDEALRALGGPGAGLIVCTAAPRRDPAPGAALGVQAVFANHDYEPAPWRATRRCAARWPTPASPAHLQGPGGLRARGTADPGRQALLRLHALQERLAGEGGRVLPARLSGGAYAAALAPRPERWRGRCPRWPNWGSSPPTCASCRCPSGARGGAQLLLETSCTHRPLRRHARLPGREGPELPERAPALRHRVDPPAGRAGARARAGSAGAATWLKELVWRDFYFQVLANFPHVADERQRPQLPPEYDASPGNRAPQPRRCSPPGARAAPATRWWTPRWRRSTRPATCTTGCAW
jgi:deoxyribodipyrimidine photo-lyase